MIDNRLKIFREGCEALIELVKDSPNQDMPEAPSVTEYCNKMGFENFEDLKAGYMSVTIDDIYRLQALNSFRYKP